MNDATPNQIRKKYESKGSLGYSTASAVVASAYFMPAGAAIGVAIGTSA